ncbi:hypothetical protein WME97_22830 [Sorangium sp. So ce367]|uniref:hypothetical protein n=1 Tax=Sorangium sp. So ce367 TaxID=3133305 RepID=UPI003F63B858
MKPISRKRQLAFVVPLLTLFACVEADPPVDGGAAACGEVAACGGDPTGSWTIESVCTEPSGFSVNNARCDVSISFDDVEYDGHAEFNVDATYALTYTPRGPMKMVIGMPCVDADGVSKTCAELDEEMRDVPLAEEPLFQSGRCGMIGEDCVCDLFVREDPRTETGVWGVLGTTLVTKEDGEEWGFKDRAFCVEGSSFTLGTEKLTEENEGKPMKRFMRLTKR